MTESLSWSREKQKGKRSKTVTQWTFIHCKLCLSPSDSYYHHFWTCRVWTLEMKDILAVKNGWNEQCLIPDKRKQFLRDTLGLCRNLHWNSTEWDQFLVFHGLFLVRDETCQFLFRDSHNFTCWSSGSISLMSLVCLPICFSSDKKVKKNYLAILKGCKGNMYRWLLNYCIFLVRCRVSITHIASTNGFERDFRTSGPISFVHQFFCLVYYVHGFSPSISCSSKIRPSL